VDTKPTYVISNTSFGCASISKFPETSDEVLEVFPTILIVAPAIGSWVAWLIILPFTGLCIAYNGCIAILFQMDGSDAVTLLMLSNPIEIRRPLFSNLLGIKELLWNFIDLPIIEFVS
jgi:hypothetical protein